MTSPRTEHLVLPGVLTEQQARATVAGLLSVQRADGAIPWFRGHHLDPWDHTETAMALDAAGEHEAAARAYDWLARHQLPDGSWYAAYADGVAEEPTDRDLQGPVGLADHPEGEGQFAALAAGDPRVGHD
ncbi:hypothetical protein ACWFRL_22100, partial [Streptomyces diastaticus]